MAGLGISAPLQLGIKSWCFMRHVDASGLWAAYGISGAETGSQNSGGWLPFVEHGAFMAP
jgi:hypothetical protein